MSTDFVAAIADNLFEIKFRLPATKAAQTASVRLPPPHVLKATVGKCLIVGDEFDGSGTRSFLEHHFRQSLHGYFHIGTDIKYLAANGGVIEAIDKSDDGADAIGDVQKTAALLAIAVHLQGLTGEGGAAKLGKTMP